jgi:hypothetical protein
MSRSHLFFFCFGGGGGSCSRFIAGQVLYGAKWIIILMIVNFLMCCVLPFLDVRKLSSLGTYWMS